MKNLLKRIVIMAASMAFASTAFAATINNDSQDFYVFRTTNISGTNGSANNWSRSTSIGENDLLSFAIYYHVTSGTAENVTFEMENIVGSYNSGETETVSGEVNTSNAGTSAGTANVTFTDDVDLRLYNVSWQPNQCTSVTCERSFPGSSSDVLGSGINVGSIASGWPTQGSMVVTFKAYADDGDDNSSSNNDDVTTKSATNVDEDSARLNGEWEGDDNIDVWFAFDENDETPSCSDSSQREGRTTVDDNEDFSETVTGLDENEKYYFRACAEDSDGDTISGSIRSFTTDEEDDDDDDDNDVDVETRSASNVDEDSARLNGEMDGDDNVDVWFAFSRTDSTPSCNASSQKEGETDVDDGDDFSETMTGLQSNTKYYFRACAEDNDGSVVSGSIKNFVTDEDDDDDNDNDDELRAVTNVASNIGTNSARLNSIVIGEGNATCYFQYGRTSSFGLTSPRVSVDLDDESSCSSVRTGLVSGGTYYYRAVIEQGGDREYGSTRTFRTNTVTTVTNNNPTVTNTNTRVTIVNRTEIEEEELDVTKWVSAEDDPRFDIFTDAMPGETVYYKVRVENNTDEDLEDVVVIDRIPFYLELDENRGTDDDDDKQVRWVIDLEAGESRTFVTEMRVREDAERGDVIISYASAEHAKYSTNSNDVEIEVERSFSNNNSEFNAQSGFIFGSGIFPTDMTGWLFLILIILAIAYFISRILVARDERAKIMAEVAAVKAARDNA